MLDMADPVLDPDEGEAPAFLTEEQWGACTDPTVPPGVIRIDGNPYPLIEFDVDDG